MWLSLSRRGASSRTTLLTLCLLAIGLEREMRWVLGSASEHLTDFRKRVLVPCLRFILSKDLSCRALH